jgi:NAD+ synthase (glutamine-hydrolysing)
VTGAPLAAHVAVASLNQTVGDWTGNARRIRAAATEARRRGAGLLVLPEMCIPGYSLGDRLMMRGTIDRSWSTLRELLPASEGRVLAVGLPIRYRDAVYDCVAVCADGRLAALVPKENLATGDVQYENRWFSGWPRAVVEELRTDLGTVPFGPVLLEAQGLGRFGFEICEDGWKGLRPGSVYALAGAHIVANPSASWFTIGKHRVRRRMVRQISREDHLVYLYTSLLGCDATRLVFDGSVFVAEDGEILAEGRRFVFADEMELVDTVVDLAGLQRVRTEEGSWRQQVEGLQRGDHGPPPPVVEIPGDYATMRSPPASAPYWLPPASNGPDPSLAWLARDGLIPRAPTERDVPHLELELALALALREYATKSRVPGFTIASSGGRDSAMCAFLVSRALRYDRPELDGPALRAHVASKLVTAYLATENSGSHTRAAARGLSEEIGATHLELDVQPAFAAHRKLAEEALGAPLVWDDPRHDVVLQNLQARVRAAAIWAIANLRGFLLLTTSNKSEAAVGYATMDGDTAGGLAPIADVPKSLVSVWLAWAAEFHALSSLTAITQHPPTAELRPSDRGQTDEADLMPFEVLDQLLFHFVQEGLEPLELFKTLWPAMREHYDSDPKAFAAHIRKFVRLFCAAQWKRDRFAISFRVAAFDLDPKTGFRFPAVQEPFTVELEELDRFVATL